MITLGRLTAALSYDPRDGLFRWIAPPNQSIRRGEVAGSKHPRYGYIRIGVDGRYYMAHRLAWLYVCGRWPEHHIDHINGDRADNRIENLRDVTSSVNSQNQRKAHPNNKGSGLLGVSQNHWKWTARIKVGGRQLNLGTYDAPEEAHAAYLTAKRQLHEGCTL